MTWKQRSSGGGTGDVGVALPVVVADNVSVLLALLVNEDVAVLLRVDEALDVKVVVAVTGHALQLAGHLSLTFTSKNTVLHFPWVARSMQPTGSRLP